MARTTRTSSDTLSTHSNSKPRSSSSLPRPSLYLDICSGLCFSNLVGRPHPVPVWLHSQECSSSPSSSRWKPPDSAVTGALFPRHRTWMGPSTTSSSALLWCAKEAPPVDSGISKCSKFPSPGLAPGCRLCSMQCSLLPSAPHRQASSSDFLGTRIPLFPSPSGGGLAGRSNRPPSHMYDPSTPREDLC